MGGGWEVAGRGTGQGYPGGSSATLLSDTWSGLRRHPHPAPPGPHPSPPSPAAALERRTGELLYAGLREGFRGTTFAGVPAPLHPGAPTAAVLAGVEALLRVFVDQGFAIAASVRDVRPASAADLGGGSGAAGGVAFTVRLEGPANLWALRARGARRRGVCNAYDALAVGAFLGASGRAWRYSLEVGETAVEERWVVV